MAETFIENQNEPTMRLSEIARYVVECEPCGYMHLDSEYIKGCDEDWYNESLIQPLMDYYMYEKLNLCGCGSPDDTYEVIRRYLHIRKDWYSKDISYEEVIERYKTDLFIDTDNDIHYGILQFLMYVLDENGFTEHGSSVGGCWLTKNGERLLAVLDAWRECEDKNN